LGCPARATMARIESSKGWTRRRLGIVRQNQMHTDYPRAKTLAPSGYRQGSVCGLYPVVIRVIIRAVIHFRGTVRNRPRGSHCPEHLDSGMTSLWRSPGCANRAHHPQSQERERVWSNHASPAKATRPGSDGVVGIYPCVRLHLTPLLCRRMSMNSQRRSPKAQVHDSQRRPPVSKSRWYLSGNGVRLSGSQLHVFKSRASLPEGQLHVSKSRA
jgi:hypothetical protein